MMRRFYGFDQILTSTEFVFMIKSIQSSIKQALIHRNFYGRMPLPSALKRIHITNSL